MKRMILTGSASQRPYAEGLESRNGGRSTTNWGVQMASPIEIFFSYAHQDEGLMNEVRQQLVIFERNRRILKWHDRKIPPGAEWRTQIDQRLKQAQVILLFVSPDFIESRYCYEVEGKTALRRQKTGEARVVPIILRPCPWQDAPFSKLQALPRDAKPITRWRNRDEACLDVARGVMAIVDEIVAQQVINRTQRPSRTLKPSRKVRGRTKSAR